MAVDSHLSTLGLPNTNNQHWSVQKKGTLITQKLETGRFSYQTGESRVWMSGKGLSEPVERDGWVFVESDGAYAGVRVVGEYAWDESDPEEGRWLRCVDDLSAIVIEVGRKAEYASVEGFQEAVVGTEMKVEDGEVRYQGLSGDRFTLNTDYSSVPEVNGEAVNYAPQYVYDSPHVRSEWDSGVVTVGYGGDEKVLDFNVE